MIEQRIELVVEDFRGGRDEAAPQLRKDPAVAGMVEALYSAPEPSSGVVSEMLILSHLMSSQEIDEFAVVKIDEGENQ